MSERVGFIKKPEQAKNAEEQCDVSMAQWRDVTVVLRRLGHALDTGPELIGFVHVHFPFTQMTSIPVPYQKGSIKCLTASGV